MNNHTMNHSTTDQPQVVVSVAEPSHHPQKMVVTQNNHTQSHIVGENKGQSNHNASVEETSDPMYPNVSLDVMGGEHVVSFHGGGNVVGGAQWNALSKSEKMVSFLGFPGVFILAK